MSFADTAPLIALLKLDDKFSGPLKNAQRTLGQFDAKLDKTATRAFRAGQQIGTGIKNGLKIAAVGLGLLATQVVVGLNQLVQLEKQTTQTNAALISTKGASGQTAASIRALAEKYENLNAVIDDKVIQSGENVLLTFTRINKEAFEPALAAALDLSVAMGQDLQSSIVQVGKALNDPAKGFTALRRVGIQFTADQEKQIKTLQESGDLLGAQKIILQELGTEFGGRFAAQGRSAEGTIAGIGDAVEDLQKGLATALFPTLQKLLPRLRDTLASPQFATTVSKVGDAIAGIFSNANIEEGGRVLTGLFNAAKSAAPALQSAAEITGRVIGTAVDLFKSLPPEIQALAVAGLAINKLTGGLVTNIAGGLISAVISSFKGAMHVTAGAVFVNGAAGGGGALPSLLAGALPVVVTLLSTAALAGLAGAIIAGVTGNDPITGIIKGGPKDAGRVGGSLFNKISPRDVFGPSTRPTYGPWTTLTEAVKSNTSAIMAATAQSRAEVRAGISADRAARGITGPFKRSTSLMPRFDFLRGTASGSKDVSVANAIATGFERGATPLFRNTKLIPRSIKELQRDQRQLLRAGDIKAANAIGHDIDRLKAELGRRTAKIDKSIRAQKMAVSVATAISTFFNGRILFSNTTRYETVYSGHGNVGGNGPR